MILEGVKLMVIGMAIVYVFLLVLMLSVMLSAKLFKDSDARAPSDPGTPTKSRKDVIPVIAAAVAAYRAKHAGDG
jgi:oxaloacetate decarboxylase gamma subunit